MKSMTCGEAVQDPTTKIGQDMLAHVGYMKVTVIVTGCHDDAGDESMVAVIAGEASDERILEVLNESYGTDGWLVEESTPGAGDGIATPTTIEEFMEIMCDVWFIVEHREVENAS